ncbi:hypothetical protein OKA04_05615 [Luteolibacter flavescens]|uniref:Uncharacterized protein n=1 Tax=Luteolibacter flavescens TaxID=1859460 RepID=A0ABT3FKU7_9BACT|nr:hypothetical protein [Luteolibacter flavescens]MCW1884199.1 hypothetical protein [Luteolibacter flavescens]
MARILWALLFLSACVEASITAAWKIPVEHFAPDYKTNDRIRKLEKPPGDSDFLQPGDELWDLSKGLTYLVSPPFREGDDPFAEPQKTKLDQPWYGEWLVWNARSGMVVACGSWNDILAAQRLIRFDELPMMVETRIELVTAGKEPLSLATKVNSGERASAEDKILGADLDALCAPSGVVDLRFHVSWPGPDKESPWAVASAVTFKDGERKKLACHGQGEGRWELFATAKSEYSNGVPVKEARWIENEGTVQVWPVLSGGDPKEGRIGDDLVVRSYLLSPYLLDGIGVGSDFTKLPLIEAPATHADWVRGRVINLHGILAGDVLKFEEQGSLVVFDPGSGRLTVVAAAEDQDAMGSYLAGLWDRSVPMTLWIETNPEVGGWGLTCRSGEEALITLGKGDKDGGPSFKIEPLAGDRDEIAELSYDFDVFIKGVRTGHLKSSTTLELGKPQEIAGQLADGKRAKAILTVLEN